MSYIIVTPVHNESKYLVNFVNSIINQTFQPKELILVDDNSTDDSAEIIKQFEKEHSWIRYKFRNSEQKKVQGSKVVEAFNFGIENESLEDLKFIAKFDADLELPKDYFESINAEFDRSPELGLIGGFIQELEDGVWTTKYDLDYHVRGALKSYRAKAFIQMDGLLPVFGWDGLDEMKLFYYGWKTKNLPLYVKHHRPAASDYRSSSLAFRFGRANYSNGCNFSMAVVRSLVRMKDKPYIITGFAFFMGYLTAVIKRDEKLVNRDLAKFINNFHKNRIFKALKLRSKEQ